MVMTVKSVSTAPVEILVRTKPALRLWLPRPGFDLAVAAAAGLLVAHHLALPDSAGTLLAGAVLLLAVTCTAAWIVALRFLSLVRRRPLPGFPKGLPPRTGALLLRIAGSATVISAVTAGGATVVLTVLDAALTWPVTVGLGIGLGGSVARLALLGRSVIRLRRILRFLR